MTALRSWHPVLDTDAMSPSPYRHVLCAVLIGSLVSAPGYAAAVAQAGGQDQQASDSNQKRDAAPGAASSRRNPATSGEQLKGGDTVTRDAGLRATRFATPHRNFGPLRGATGNIATPAIPGARANLPRRSKADQLASARWFGDKSSALTGRPPSAGMSAASRSVAGLKPLAA